MAVADVYDALASRRRYKEPLPHKKVVEVIRQDTGHHFDPEVVDIFASCEQQFEQVFQELKDE
jgi:putative two-component system response regulator